MPQPYRGSHVSVCANALLRRPRIAALVAESIAAFSRIEVQIANVYASVLDVSENIALEIYLDLQSDGPRAAILDGRLRERLNKKDYKLVSNLRQRKKTLSKWRNDFSHHVWANGDGLSEYEILLVGHKELVWWFRRLQTMPSGSSLEKIVAANKLPALVFNEKEIGEYQDTLNDFSEEIFDFSHKRYRQSS